MNFQALARAYLKRGGFLVNVDTRRQGVIVPDYYLNLDQCFLLFAKNQPIPITRLRATATGCEGDLYFKVIDASMFCVVPWTAVLTITPVNYYVPALRLYEASNPALSPPRGVLQSAASLPR